MAGQKFDYDYKPDPNRLDQAGSHDAPEMHMSAGSYIKSRFTTLKPPMTRLANPITLLRMLTLSNWLNFLLAFCGCKFSIPKQSTWMELIFPLRDVGCKSAFKTICLDGTDLST